MVNKPHALILTCLLCIFCSVTSGQNIKGHYVARSQEDGTLYYTMPVSLFKNDKLGDLTFDLTYKQNSKTVTMNFTYLMEQPTSADSIKIINGSVIISGETKKIYIEPYKNMWKHRYTLSDSITNFNSFYTEKNASEAIIYAGEKEYRYKVKKSAWKNYLPIGNKIFQMIELNEKK
ncbi:MAG: hypothetical protein RR293_07630 [Bacteroidales bacterium]